MILDELDHETKRESKLSFAKIEENGEIRTTLPAFKAQGDFSLLKGMKGGIGKDLSKFSVPLYLNEPLSMLQ